MKQWLLDILQYNMLRNVWHRLSHFYTDEECYARFIVEMNKCSKGWGLNNTKWINPSGLGENNVYSASTANDLSIMALYAFAMGGVKFNIISKNMN